MSSIPPAGTPPTAPGPGPDWTSALELAASRGAAVQLSIRHRGQPVLDGARRCSPQALGWLFSAGKPFTSLLVHRLAARGRLHLDDPVARHWPEFGIGGGGSKSEVTVREVLTHRTGLPSAGPYPWAVLTMQDEPYSARRVAAGRRRSRRYRPRQDGFGASAAPAYQALDFGVILRQVVESVTGTDWAQALREHVLEPEGLTDVHPGVPDDDLHRCLPLDTSVRALPGGPVVGRVINRAVVRQARIPAAGISTTAAELARFWERLLHAPEWAAMTVPSSAGDRDGWTHLPTRWGTGVQLGGTGSGCPLGATSTERTAGHNGSDVCLGWADPELELAVGIVTDRASGHPGDRRLLAEVSDLIRSLAASA